VNSSNHPWKELGSKNCFSFRTNSIKNSEYLKYLNKMVSVPNKVKEMLCYLWMCWKDTVRFTKYWL